MATSNIDQYKVHPQQQSPGLRPQQTHHPLHHQVHHNRDPSSLLSSGQQKEVEEWFEPELSPIQDVSPSIEAAEQKSMEMMKKSHSQAHQEAVVS